MKYLRYFENSADILYDLIYNRDYKKLKDFLKDNDVDLNIPLQGYTSPLCLAITSTLNPYNPIMVNTLLKNGADVNYKTPDREYSVWQRSETMNSYTVTEIENKSRIQNIFKTKNPAIGRVHVIVGMARFELATSWSQTRRDNRATLHPELKNI